MPSRWPCGKKAPVKSKEREKKMNTVRSALAVAACMLATGLAQAHDAASGDFGANSGRYNTSGKLNQISGFLASQLANNRDLHNVSESRIAVVSFVSIESLKETNKIGLLLAENLMHDFQIRGFPVVDFKAMNAIQVTAAGDFVHSQINKLKFNRLYKRKRDLNIKKAVCFCKLPLIIIIFLDYFTKSIFFVSVKLDRKSVV